jgi:hypothetical protein
MNHSIWFTHIYLEIFCTLTADICFVFPIQEIFPSEDIEYTSSNRRETPASVLLTLKLEHK